MPTKSSTTNVPHPAGTTAPENENPRTVFVPAETTNPAPAESPPDPPLTVAPSILN